MLIGSDRRWQLIAQAYGLLVSAVLGYFLFGLTVQVSDSFGNLLAVQQPTLSQLVGDQFSQQAYLRPLLWAQIKIVYELAGGNYFLWFRGVHVAQVIVLIALCVHLMRPRTMLDAALVPLALAVIVGAHTFVPTLREAFPINAFLTIVIACVAAAVIAAGPRPRWYADMLAILLFVGSVLTLESGLLVWVVSAAAYALGMRGVSRGAVAAMTACVVVYFAVRMFVLDVGTPALAERASGFGFNILEPRDLMARFGANAWLFYGYNVASSIATVLFAEPKGGVWRFVWEITVGQVHPWTAILVLSSTASTVLVAWFLVSRRQRIGAWTLDHDDRLVLLFAVVLAANAFISFPYTKNIIMSPAGVFLGLAVYAASRTWFDGQEPGRVWSRLAMTVALFAVLTIGWTFRVVGNHYNLRRAAAEQRAAWVSVDSWLDAQRIALTGTHAHTLRDTLRRDALWVHPTPYQPAQSWSRWFDIDW